MAIHPGNTSLLTDLYELKMADIYLRSKMVAPAVFSLFIRTYPRNRNYFVSAGLGNVLKLLSDFHYDSESLEYLQSTGLYSNEFLRYLEQFTFTGSVRAIPEGRLAFADEPLLEVTAPLPAAQLIETHIINLMNVSTAVATKASRCRSVSDKKSLVDFSLRRTQGRDAGLCVARSSYIAGFNGSSNVLAGKLYGVPVFGTMAHSFVTAFSREIDSFRAFARAFPDSTTLLIDTYDTLKGARNAVIVGNEMKARGEQLNGVRLDSGNLIKLSRKVRNILDKNGLPGVKIIASGSLDEFRLKKTIEADAPIDGFGVGTRMGVSEDAPYLDMAYKMVEYDGVPVLKLSQGKESLAGPKQVFRLQENGKFTRDTVTRLNETLPGEALLEPFFIDGTQTRTDTGVEDARKRCEADMKRLKGSVRAIGKKKKYPVDIAPALQKLQNRTRGLMTERLESGQ